MKIFFAINAGGRKPPSESLIARMEDVLQASGREHRVVLSRSLDEAKAQVDNAVREGFDTLWMGGGDGTVNVLLNFALGSNLTLGVVPLGTVNALARSLRMPLKPVDAVRYLLECKPVPMDVGEVNGRYFLCFASIGFDASVVNDVPGFLKTRYGRAAYLWAGIKAAFRMERIVKFDAELSNAEFCGPGDENRERRQVRESGYSLILSNIRNYAGFDMFHRVEPCSGMMEVFLFHENRILPMLGWTLSAAAGRRMRADRAKIGHYMLDSLELTSREPMFVQLDGEAASLGDNTKLRFRCIPAAARILAQG